MEQAKEERLRPKEGMLEAVRIQEKSGNCAPDVSGALLALAFQPVFLGV